MILKPESAKSKTIGRVWLDGARCVVAAKFPEKHDVWRLVCKKLLYAWSGGQWERTFGASADLNERAAELTHRLLLAGFIVEVPDTVAPLVTTANYTPESFRHVRRYVAGEYADWFCLTWARHEDLYGLATRLPSAHWDGRAVVVSREYFAEVLDFAEVHGFSVSDGAHTLAAIARQEQDSMLIVQVPPLPSVVPVADKRAALAAPEFVEIDRDLLDDEYDDSAA